MRQLVESLLEEAGIFDPGYVELVANHQNSEVIFPVLELLQQEKMLGKANMNVVATHAYSRDLNPMDLYWALTSLQGAMILNQEHFDLVARHAKPLQLSWALCHLQGAGISNQDNRVLVDAHANLPNLSRALAYLTDTGILNQVNFDALIHAGHAALLTDAAREPVWNRLAARHLTQVNFQRLLTASEQPNAMQALEAATNQILGIAPNIGAHAQALNPAQSTHTASVHRSVSESARKLRDSYSASLDLEQKVDEIKAFINGLPDSPKNAAARRCIARITAVDYAYTDQVSDVSTRQLLALVFTAIHDDERRCDGSGTEDALNSFVEALYEIQRGYNLSPSGQDQGGDDMPICIAGTFNKLLEKLNGIHHDVTIVMITKAQASLKLPIVVREEALAYLSARANPATSAECIAFTRLMQSIKKDGVEDIWGNIKAQVAERIFDEFGSLYDNQEHPEFQTLIESGQDLAIVDLVDSFQKELALSEGYRQYLSMILSASSMFAHNNSPEFASSLSTSAAPQ